jgi:uncharacterized protein YkwD
MKNRRHHIRLASAAAISAGVLAFAGAPAASADSDAPAACSSAASGIPGQVSRHSMSNATLCLVNAERAKRGMRPLRINRRLSRAAYHHAADMVRRDYFSHYTPIGTSFVERIRRTGYLKGPRAWIIGENLAWGSGDRSSPAAVVRAWMKSPGHRANILQRRFRQVGIGLVIGAPDGPPSPAATYATDFGARS